MPLSDIVILWIPWVEFALLVVLFMIGALQPHALACSIQEVTNPVQRRYADGGDRGVVYWIQGVFQLGVIAMTTMMSVKAYWSVPIVRIEQFGWIVLLCLAVGIMKNLLDYWIQQIFRYGIHLPTYLIHRSRLWQVGCIVLLAYLLFAPMWSDTICWVVPLSIAICYWCIMTWKLIMQFGISIEHVIYIIIYIVHNEVLPIALIIAGNYRIMNI